MRNVRIAMMAALLALTAGSAQADGLTVDGVTMNAGTVKNVEVVLTQDAAKYAAFQFDLVLPAGLTMQSGELATAQTSDMTHSVKAMADGSQRFVVYSPTLQTAKSGAVVTLALKADKRAEAGSYSLQLKNIVLSDTEGNKTKPADVTAQARIEPPVKVTAKNISRVYGEANGTLEYEVGENYTGGSPTISCEANAASPVGSYDIVVGKGTIEADTVTLVNGTLTVTKAPLTITALSYTRKQGEENPAFAATYTGWKNGETEAVLKKQPTMTCTVEAGSAIGTYTITPSDAEAENYDISYVAGKLTVTQADPVTVTAKSYTRFYGDENPVFEYEASGAALQGEPLIECDATASSPAGTYTIKISKGSVKNFNDKYVAGVLTITPAQLTITAKSYTRKQGEANPKFEVSYEGWKNKETVAVLTKQPTVTCEATAASEPGEYDITVSGGEAGNYAISYVAGKLTVVDADAVVVTAKSYKRVYGEANPTFEYEVSGAQLDGKPVITCEATAASPVGEYDIVISKGTVKNYNDKYVAGKLTITKAPLTITAKSYTRKQGEANPEFAISYEGFVNGETEAVLTKQPTVTCEATAASEPGEYDITVSGGEAGNYAISYVAGKLTVVDADAVVVTAKSYKRVYGEANPTFEYEVSGAQLDGKPVITCEATAASPVGEYDIVVSKGTVKNYNDKYVTGKLTITKAPLTITAKSYTRKQGEENPEFSISYEGFVNGETATVLTKLPTVTCEATAASKPGEYDIMVSGAEAGNYDTKFVTGKLTVTEADPVTVTAKSYSRVYGEANPTFKYEVGGAKLDGEPVITCEATAASPVGEYDIVVSKGTVKNYNDKYVAGKLTITKAPLTITAKSYTRKQGEADPEFAISYDGFVNGETEAVLTKLPTVNCEATAESEPGEYDITVSGGEAGNYEMNYVVGKLTVTEADAVVVTAKSYSRVYGEANPTFEYEVSGAKLDGEPVITCEATAASPVGEYDIVVSKGTVKNYNDKYVTGKLTITKAPLTITAKSYTRKQGEANPEFAISYEGFVNGETEAVLTKLPTVNCEATAESEPGEYDITVSSCEAGNYEMNYVVGKLTVTEADAVVVTAKSYSRVYGEANPTFEYEVSGAKLDGEPLVECEATATSPVGTYPIIIKKGGVKNYNDTYVNGVLTVTPAPLTVTVGTYTKRQYDPMPEFAISYEGFVNGETAAVLTKLPTVTCEADADSKPGEYTITVSGGEAGNYEMSYVAGKLTVMESDKIGSAAQQGVYIVRIYTVGGKPLKELQRGVNIVVMSDGTRRTILVK